MKETKEAKIKILQKDSKVLREISTPIPLAKIKSTEIKSVISNLKKAIKEQADAVAISAVQIGKPIRLFVISKRAFTIVEGDIEKTKEAKDLVFINPKIT